MASRNNVGARAAAKQGRAVDLAVGEYQREASLEDSDAINSPASHDFIQYPLGAGEILPTLAEWKIGNILRGQRAFPVQIVIVLNRSYARLQPCRQRIGIANELRVGVSDRQ